MSWPDERDETKTNANLQLHLAIQHALSSAKEGPWYGVYNLVLRPLEIVQRGPTGTTATVMFPQHPVAIDIFELDDEAATFSTSFLSIDPEVIPASPVHASTPITTREASSGSYPVPVTPSPDQLNLASEEHGDRLPYPIGPATMYDNITTASSPNITTYSDPASPPAIRLRQSALNRTSPPAGGVPVTSPSNPFYEGPKHSLPGLVEGQNILRDGFLRNLVKRPRVSDSEGHSIPSAPFPTLTTPSTAGGSIKSIRDSVIQQLRIRATQIPDFLRFVFHSTEEGIVSRVDLIVENKRTYRDRDRYLVGLAFQTFRQAQFVFTNDSKVEVVACLMAIGEYWSYREIRRTSVGTAEMKEQILKARGADMMYKPALDPTNSDSSFVIESSPPPYPFKVRQNTNSDAFTHLQEAFPLQYSMISIRDQKTATLIKIIRTRLQELNQDMWPL